MMLSQKIELSIAQKKELLKKLEGFAISSVSNKDSDINYSDLFMYTKQGE